MGSFNLACGVSGMSIGYEDKARVMFIAQQKQTIETNCHCYPTDIWYPISFAIPAEYDDYGIFKFDETSVEWLGIRYYLASQIHEANLIKKYDEEREKKAKSKSKVENPNALYFKFLREKSNVDPKIVKSLTVEKVFNLMHEGKLKTAEGLNIETFPVAEEIWKRWGNQSYMSYSDTKIDLNWFIKDMTIEIADKIDREIKYHSDNENFDIERWTAHVKASAMYEYGKYNYDIMDSDYPWKYSIGASTIEHIIERKCELWMFVTRMNSVNKMITPTMTSGQGEDCKSIHALHKVCASVAKIKHNKSEREYGYSQSNEPERFIK